MSAARCTECGTEFVARAGSKYCSALCRQRAHRHSVTVPVTDVTDTPAAVTDVTDVTDVNGSELELDLGIEPTPLVEAELVPSSCSTPRCQFMATQADGLCNFCRVGITP